MNYSVERTTNPDPHECDKCGQDLDKFDFMLVLQPGQEKEQLCAECAYKELVLLQSILPLFPVTRKGKSAPEGK